MMPAVRKPLIGFLDQVTEIVAKIGKIRERNLSHVVFRRKVLKIGTIIDAGSLDFPKKILFKKTKLSGRENRVKLASHSKGRDNSKLVVEVLARVRTGWNEKKKQAGKQRSRNNWIFRKRELLCSEFCGSDFDDTGEDGCGDSPASSVVFMDFKICFFIIILRGPTYLLN